MKTKLYHILSMGGILILLGVDSGYAQTSVALKATIPFAFRVMDHDLPAGNYTVTFARNENKEAIWIKNQAASLATCAITFGHMGKRTLDNPYLVFNRYGDQYFLTQVWTYGDVARELVKSRSEREILQSAIGELAHKKITTDKIVIAAR